MAQSLGTQPSVYLKKKSDCIVREVFGERRFENAAAIVIWDKLGEALPLLKRLGITRVFSPSASRGVRCKGVEVIPILFFLRLKQMRSFQKKDLLYSFIGGATHAVRRPILRMKRHKDTVIVSRPGFFGKLKLPPAVKDRITAEYIDILFRSRFALCPSGVSLITYRFTEALCAGAIPVVIADNLVLPPGVDWKKCIIHVNERDVGKLDKIIRSIPKEREDAMRQACLDLVRRLEDDPAYFIRAYFAKIQQAHS